MFSLISSLTTSLEKLFSGDSSSIKVDSLTSNGGGVIYRLIDNIVALSNYLLIDNIVAVR